MFLSLPLALAAAAPSPDALTKFTELIALHGVYALLAIFLFYQQRRTLADARAGAGQERVDLLKIYKGTVWATYALMAIAIPIWVYSTFFYAPETLFRGYVDNLTQTQASSQNPGQAIVDEQVTPEQQNVDYYSNPAADPMDPSKVMVKWALVESGQYSKVTLVLLHRFKELVPAGDVPLDPNNPSQPAAREIPLRKKFVVELSALPAAQKTFNIHYDPDPVDPIHKIGTLSLLRNGGGTPVKLEDALNRAAGDPSPTRSSPSWFTRPMFALQSVFAAAPPNLDANAVARLLPLLGNRDLKSQLMAEQLLSTARTIPWAAVNAALTDPKSTADHALLVHNLATVIAAWSKNGIAVPAEVRLNVAKNAYTVSDFKTAAPLFNGLSDAELGSDLTVWYSRGVSNLQTGNYAAASKDLSTYASKAPTPGAKAVAQRTLMIANQKAQAR